VDVYKISKSINKYIKTTSLFLVLLFTAVSTSPIVTEGAAIELSLDWSFDTGSDVFSSPCIVDLGADGEFEILVGSEDNSLYCFESNGNKT
jgi:outer membrane protein assembly factor BamB